MKRALTTLTAALLGTAAAQEIATSLPLTSVGDKLMWTVGDQDLRLVVGVGSRVQLDVYGAQFDPADYRTPDQYGDENYDPATPKAPVGSTFTLLDAEGQVVRQQEFGQGAQDWQTFLNSDLKAGTYTLRVRTQGNGKNTFALRLTSVSAAVEADHLNVTVRSNDWVPALNVYNPGGPMSIRMYDGDGPGELQGELRDAQGTAYPVKVSGQLQWDEIQLPEGQGNYTLYLRQPPKTFQWSNSVGFELSTGPIQIVTADTTGKLDIRAELVLPDETLPTQANVTVGEQTYAVQGQAGPFTLPARDYPVQAEPVKGAEVSVNAPSATVTKGQTAHVAVQVKPSLNLSFTADKPEVCVGDVVTFTARATTDFERQTLPASLRVALPAGFEAQGETSVTARVDAANPGVLTFEARAVAATQGEARATLAPWNQTRTLGVQVLPSATQIELRRAPLAATLPGETVTVTLTLRNTSAAPAPFELTDQPGETLEALEPTSFSGELQPGEERTLSYRARVKGTGGEQGQLSATLTSNCATQQVVGGTLGVTTPPPPAPTPVVTQTRESTVRIPYDVPTTRNATQVVVAHQPPAGASYVPGSSQLSGRPLADPQVGASGTLYWTTPGAPRGVLTYRVTHEGSLPALQSPTLVGKYAGGQVSVLVGEGTLDDLSALQPVTATQARENSGALKLPLDGAVYRDRDRVTVVVESPADSAELPLINGAPVDPASLGRKTVDAERGTQRQEFYGVALRSGENTLTFAGQTVRVSLAGTPVSAEFSGQQLIADGVTPIRVGLRLTDAAGVSTASGTVTVQATLEPTQPDAQPRVVSYQVKLTDGEGVLELEPLAAPAHFDVRVRLGDRVISKGFEALPSRTRVGIGMLSVGGVLGGSGVAAGEARAQGYLETPVGDGKLYVAASGALTADRTASGATTVRQDRDQGLPTTANPLQRYPTHGDSSTETLPLQGIDPVAVRYEHPAFSVSYRQAPLPIDVFNVGVTPTALSGFTRGTPAQLSGFVAALPGDLKRVTLDANGLRALPLPDQDLAPDSETVTLLLTDPVTGAQERRPLARLSDYTLDPASGVLYVQRPLNLLDDQGRTVRVELSYRLNDPLGARILGWGVQGKYRVTDTLSVAAAAVNLGGVTSVGARARYDDGSRRADLLAAYAAQGTLVDGSASVQGDRFAVSGSVHYQTPGYAGLNAAAPGLGAAADATYRLTDRFALNARAAYTATPAAGSTPATSGGTADLRGLYTFSPFTLGAGIRAGFGDQQGVAAIVSAAYARSGLGVQVDHVQAISGTLDTTTTVKASVPVAENVTLTARDDITWGEGQRASLGLTTTLGGTNLSVNYDLPGADGWGNRARIGVDTTLPVSDRAAVDLRGSLILDTDGDAQDESSWNAGAGVRYKADALSATLAADAARTDAGFSVALKGGATYSVSDGLTLSAEGHQIFGAGAGANYAVSGALRAGPWQGLSYLRYKDGALAGGTPELIGEANVEYHVPRYALRAGLAGRALLAQPGSATYQGSLSGTYYVTDRLGLGLAARGLVQPATGSTLLSAGLEASYRALPGTWLTVGYNPVGFQGVGTNVYTRQGAYLRLDLMLDDAQRPAPAPDTTGGR